MRVNAKLLANYERQTVCLVGRVLQCEPQGMSFRMESPDKQVVQIIMKKPYSQEQRSNSCVKKFPVNINFTAKEIPEDRYGQMKIQEPLEGIIEVVGQVTAKLAIVCESYVVFPPALADNFDMASYNAVVECLQNSKDYYPTMSS